MFFSGYMMDRKGLNVIVGSGEIDLTRVRWIDGYRHVAVVGPRGGIRGWVTRY